MTIARILGRTTSTPYRALEVPPRDDAGTLAFTGAELYRLMHDGDDPPGLLTFVSGHIVHADGTPLARYRDVDDYRHTCLFTPRPGAWHLIAHDPGHLPAPAGSQARDVAARSAQAWGRAHPADAPDTAGLDLWRSALQGPALAPRTLGSLAAALTSPSTFGAVLHSLLPWAQEADVRAYAHGLWKGPFAPHDPWDEPMLAAVFTRDDWWKGLRPSIKAHRALPVLAEIVAHSLGERVGAGPLALWGFVHWWYGNHASSRAAAAAALQVDPVHTLAMVLHQLTDDGEGIPGWLQD